MHSTHHGTDSVTRAHQQALWRCVKASVTLRNHLLNLADQRRMSQHEGVFHRARAQGAWYELAQHCSILAPSEKEPFPALPLEATLDLPDMLLNWVACRLAPAEQGLLDRVLTLVHARVGTDAIDARARSDGKRGSALPALRALREHDHLSGDPGPAKAAHNRLPGLLNAL